MFPKLSGCHDLIIVYILKDHLLFNKPSLSKPDFGMYVPETVANPPAPQPGLSLRYSRQSAGRIQVGTRASQGPSWEKSPKFEPGPFGELGLRLQALTDLSVLWGPAGLADD